MNPLIQIVVAVVLTLIITNLGIHKIEEGHVGVYYRVSNYSLV